MYARMTIMMIHPDRIDDAVAIYKKSVVPAARRQRGFRGVCLLKDAVTGKGVSVTFWIKRGFSVLKPLTRVR